MKLMHATRLAWLVVAAVFSFPAASTAAEEESNAVQSDPWATQPSSPSLSFSWKPLRYLAGLESKTAWLQDSSAKRMMGKRTSREGGLSLGCDLLDVLDKTTLAVDLGWLATRASTSLEFSGETEQLHRNLFVLGVSLRYQLWWQWLAPYLRVAGAGGWDKLTVGPDDGYLRDTRRFGEISVGGGLYLRSPGLSLGKTRPFGLIARIEGGYSVGSSSSFTLKSTLPTSGDNVIPIAPIAAGSIARNVPYLRVMVGIGF
jgi:hypothetical protein